MRRLLAIAALLGALADDAGAQSVTARLGGELTGTAGMRLSVPVVVDMRASGGQRLGSYTATLTWPTRTLTFCQYCGLDSILGNFAPPQIAYAESSGVGILRFTAAAPLGADGEVVIARVPLYVNFDSAATLVLSFTEMSASGTFANLLPILSVQGGQYCPARGRYGDLDGDQRANSRDALLVLSHAVGLPLDTLVPDISLGDVDADGQVGSRDALIILSYAVGLGIPGQRVLVLAPGACATGSPRFVRVSPDTAELVPGQPVMLVATAADSAGRPVTLPGVVWRTSNPGVAGVEASGVVTARGPGTVTITAEAAPGLRATAVVTVVPRRPNWYVNLAAISSPVQLGTAARPFARPADAFRYLSEGDTVRIAPGRYLVDGNGVLDRGAVIIGGTPGDTTTRPVLRDDTDYSVLWLRGGNRTEVHNIAFENPYIAMDIEGVRNLIVRDVRVTWPGSGYGYGVYHCGDAVMDTLRIERSVFMDDSADTDAYGVYISGCVSPYAVRVMEVRNTTFRDLYEGLDLYDVDSLYVERSLFERLYYAIQIGTEYEVSFPAFVMRSSRIRANYYDAVYGYGMRRAVLDSSFIETRYSTAIDLEGDCCGGPRLNLLMRHDTIVMRSGTYYDDWLGVYAGDSVRVSDVLVQAPPDTSTAIESYFDEINWLRVERTRFLNVGYGSRVLDIFDTRQAQIDSVLVTACPIAACWGAYGVYANGTVPNRRVSVTRSRFQNVAYPIYAWRSGAAYHVRNVEVDSAYLGMYIEDADSSYVADNVLRRITYQGIVLYRDGGSGRPMVVERDSVLCLPSATYGFNASYARASFRRNFVSGCSGAGAYAGWLRPGSLFLSNTLRLNATGVHMVGDTTTIVVDSNAISQSTIGVYTAGPRLLARGNNVRNNSNYGFDVQTCCTNLVHRLEGNALKGNALRAVRASYDSVHAPQNWWGVDGASPGSPGADSVSGRVGAPNPLASEPAVPSLAPPLPRLQPLAASAPPAPVPAANPNEQARPPAYRPNRSSRSPDDPALRARAQMRESRRERQQEAVDQRREERRSRRAQLRGNATGPR